MGTPLGEFSKAAADVIAGAAPSVVGVGPAGSGVVIGYGLVVTNAHNLRGEIAVTFEDGRVATATVAGADLDGDLAVLSVDTAEMCIRDRGCSFSSSSPRAKANRVLRLIAAPWKRSLAPRGSEEDDGTHGAGS